MRAIKLYAQNLTCQSWYRFTVRNTGILLRRHGVPLRVRVAWWFRRFADAIDGSTSYSYELTSTPVVPLADRQGAIEQGVTLTKKLFDELVEKQAIEEAMHERIPELYEKPTEPHALKPE